MNDFELKVLSAVRLECYEVKGECIFCDAYWICNKLFDGDSPLKTDIYLKDNIIRSFRKSHIEEGDTDDI